MEVRILEADSTIELSSKINSLIKGIEETENHTTISLSGSMVVYQPHNKQRPKFYQTIIIK